MVKEYIEREPILKQIRAEGINLLEQEGRRTNEVLAYGHCFGMVDSAPTADVAPVKHGRWVPYGNAFFIRYECSACGNGAFDSNFAYGARYCPICGAKMDLKGE